MIDPATGWFEIVEATNKSATSIQELFHNTWLARYPRPQFIVFDNGGEFKREFKQMCDKYGIKAKPTTSHNLQANAIIEQVEKVVNDMLRSFDLENNHENLEEDNPFDYFFQSTAWLPCYEKHLSYNTAGNTMSTCVWQRYDPQYCLQSKLGSNTKRKQESNTKKKTGHYNYL
jgi:hypothetical protein